MSVFDQSSTSSESEIKEGLLCPICMQDLGTVIQLEQHFENVHSAEDTAILNSLKDLFGKAKRKILRKNSQTDDDEDYSQSSYLAPRRGSSSISGSNELNWDPQETGVCVSHTEVFRQIRSSRIDSYVVETNKLLIRLDKLIVNVPSDPHKRKAYEQSVVNWVNDSDVKLCPTCARSFSIARRRHHCRLCGGVMCMNCSMFLEFSYAKKLTNPAFMCSDSSLSSSYSPTHHSQQQSPSSTNSLFPLRRTGSSSSLASMINYSSGEQHIRVCVDCHKFLERRDQQIEQRTNKPTILLYYDKMKSAIEEAKRLVPVYCKLADSLNLGETNYHLKDAQDLKMKLMKIAETVDVYSKKILMIGLKNDPPPHPKEIQLQKMVRQSASSFLQDNMVGLVKLPTEGQLQELQESRRQLLQKQILAEKQEALLAQQRLAMATNSAKKSTPEQHSVSRTHSISKKEYEEPQPPKVVNVDEGWASQTISPSIHSSSNQGQNKAEDEDPMLQQINNIKLFIKQARQAHKYDEVEILEANLKLLQEEFRKQ